MAPATSGRLRVVAFAGGAPSAIDGVFLARLARDPLLELTALIVDEFRTSRKRAPLRILHGMRREGWPWLSFRLASALAALVRKAALWLFELAHEPREGADPYEALEREAGVPVHRVADIHGEQSLCLIRSLRPQLGLIVGTRILRHCVIDIPEFGTLNIHKRKVPDYRGGGPVGYWEVLAGEASIGVTIHYATAQVDAGDVLAEATIPIEECDTLESLRIKADLRGAQLYHEAIRAIALGRREGTAQDPRQGTTYRAPSALRVWQLERRLRRRAARRMSLLRARPPGLTRMRVLLQYALVSPLLHRLRRRLQKQRRAPVCILFYHLVANRPLNHMCLPLEEFVRQMELLRRYYPLITVEEAAARLHHGNDEVAVAVTFDDGYRDNAWAIEYLRYFGIPACFFVCVGHVLDGTPFAHDRRRGFEGALPMREADLRRLAADGFKVGSHGIHHEDFGGLESEDAERVLGESRRLIGELTGSPPDDFSFPKGQAGTNITAPSFAAASRHYRRIYSAYGGYNIPGRQSGSHLLRIGNPTDVEDLATVLDGYTGLRRCLAGDAWGLHTADLAPYQARTGTRETTAARLQRLFPRRAGR